MHRALFFQKRQFIQRIMLYFSKNISFYHEFYNFDIFLAPGGASGGAKPSRAEPGRAEPSRAEPGRAEPSHAEASRARPSRAEPSRSEPTPCRAETSRAEPSRAEPGRILCHDGRILCHDGFKIQEAFQMVPKCLPNASNMQLFCRPSFRPLC